MTDLPVTKPLDEELCLMVLISAIDVGDRMRDVDEYEAAKLSESIAMRGLDNAITLREIPGETHRFKLVSGGHRIRAHQMLGLEYIRADLRQMPDDEATAIERDENFFRFGLTVVESALAVGTFIDDWEAANGKLKWGGDRSENSKMTSCHLANPFEDLSEKSGKSKRTMQRLNEYYRKLGPDTLRTLRGNNIEDNASELKALSDLGHEQQRACANSIVAGDFKSVKEWRRAVGDDNGPVLMTPEEEWEVKFVDLWERGRPAWRKNILRKIEAGKL